MLVSLLLLSCGRLDVDASLTLGDGSDDETCFLEVLNCDETAYLVFLDGESVGTLAPGDEIETVPGLERLESCSTDEFSGLAHNLDIRTNANQPGAATTFQYDHCASVIVSGGELHVDCEHMYCSYWSR